MQSETVERMLKEYKKNIGRAEYLEKAIEETAAELKRQEYDLINDVAGNGCASLDGMPHGTKISQPTERAAIMLATGYKTEDMEAAQDFIEDARRELRRLKIEITFVDAWLKGLTEKERFLIEQYYFEDLTYNETAQAYKGRFGILLSRDGIRRQKKEAVEAIARMAE